MTIVGRGSVGTPLLPVKQAFLFSVLELLAAGASEIQSKGTVTPSMPEDEISQRLDEAMELLYQESESDIVNWAMRPASRVVPGDPRKTSEVDFRFHWNQFPRDQCRFLGVEAKRLRGTGTSLAGEYVRHGVMRFVTGQYSLGHDYAVMMGYVVIGPAAGAISKVKTAMNNQKRKTSQRSRMAPDGSLPRNTFAHKSRHLQNRSGNQFTIFHLFFDFSLPA